MKSARKSARKSAMWDIIVRFAITLERFGGDHDLTDAELTLLAAYVPKQARKLLIKPLEKSYSQTKKV